MKNKNVSQSDPNANLLLEQQSQIHPTSLYVGNLPDVPDDQIIAFLTRIGPFDNLQINRKILGEPFCHFTTLKPNTFLDVTGRKLNDKKVLFQLAKRKQFDHELARQQWEQQVREADQRWAQSNPVQVQPGYYINMDEAMGADRPESFNDAYDDRSAAELKSIAFSAIPRRFFEPTEFKPVAQKKRPMLFFTAK